MMKAISIVSWTILAALTAPAACAATIVSYTAGMDPPSDPAYFAESFTTPSGGPWNSITFNYYADAPAVTPEAIGDAFLLSSEYLGTPGALSSVTPGFVAESTSISGGKYVFDPSVTLNPDTQYWLYETGLVMITGKTVGAGTPAEHAYGSNGNDYVSLPGAVANFAVSGTVASTVPEPSSCALLGIGLLGGLLLRARRSQFQ